MNTKEVSDVNYQAAIITMSDSRCDGSKEDLSAKAIRRIVEEHQWEVAYYAIIDDEYEHIRSQLLKCSDELQIPLILTTGGTGFSQRDNTPEATLSVIEKQVPGISEAMRAKSMEVTPKGMLSRGVSGIRNKSLIVNLPGSPKAVSECLEYVIDPILHGVMVLLGDVKNCGEHHG